MHQQETAIREVNALRQHQVLPGLGDGDHLRAAGRSRRGSDLVPCPGVAVDGIDTPVTAHELGERDRDVTGAGADVDAPPARHRAEALESGRERPPVQVVAQPELAHGADGSRRTR